jgi:FAD-dependent urate hydroxylase
MAGQESWDVVVVGAGPYGLASTAALREAGIATKTFGRPLSFWKERMPAGMRLRSSWGASSIGHPRDRFQLDEFQTATGRSIERPIPLDDFIAYGTWFQEHAVPDLDERRVERIARANHGFEIHVADGAVIGAGRVVMATGLDGMAWYPPPFDRVDRSRVTHAVDVRDPSRFAGAKVLVIGAGQSAVECAVLVHEAGADVEIVAREHSIRWLTRSGKLHRLPGWLQRALYAPTDVGPPGLSWIVATPNLYRRLPRRVQGPISDRSIRPAASGWLLDRSDGVRRTECHQATSAVVEADGVEVVLDDGTRRHVDHVILGTGYRVDVSTHPLLADNLRLTVKVDDGLPVLRNGFESSVPGLHFVGAAAVGTYGPLMRFVSGTPFAARHLAATIAAR